METTTFIQHAPGQIRQGLPYEELERLIQLLDLSQHEAAALLLISERTLSRRRREGRLTQAESDRLVRLTRLTEDATDAFDGDLETAVTWLRSEHTLLGGETPLQYADTAPGFEAVRDMLGVIQYTMAA
jgi:putative toxin-antitoxin system antitoxin component (TIGR02293 family)